MKTIIVSVLLLSCGSLVNLRADLPSARMSADTCYTVGVNVGAQYNSFTGSYGSLPGTRNCCPQFTEGSAIKPMFSGVVGIPISRQLHGQVRLGYTNFGVDLTRTEFIGNALVPDGGDFRVVDAVSEYSNKVSSTAVGLNLRLQYYPLNDVPAYIHAGLSASYQSSMNLDESERLVAPVSAVFSDSRSSTRNVQSVSIADKTSMFIAPVAGLGFDLRFGADDKYTVSPELGIAAPLGSLVTFPSDKDRFSVVSAYAGLTLLYSFRSERAALIPPPPPPPPVAAPAPLCSVVAREVLPTGDRDVAEVVINETISNQMYPLIPFVFFEENSDEIPSRYVRLTSSAVASFDTTARFKFDNVDNRSDVTLKVYYNMLNILGSRMVRYPGSTLTISGYASAQDKDQADVSLPRRRAEAVRSYLMNTFGIAGSRLVLKYSRLSPNAARSAGRAQQDEADAHAENRRVEFSSDDAALLEPLQVFDTLRTVRNPVLRFYLTAKTSSAVSQWSVKATHPDLAQGTPYLVKKEGTGTPPSYLEWSSEDSQRDVPRSADPIDVHMDIMTQGGAKAESNSKLSVQYNTVEKRRKNMEGDIEVNTYRVVGFDYDLAVKNRTVSTILERYVSPDLSTADTVVIRGFTDRLGSASVNQSLAQQRAETVRSMMPIPTTTTVVKPVGLTEEQSLFRNDLAEQRMYNRMVEIVVKKNSR